MLLKDAALLPEGMNLMIHTYLGVWIIISRPWAPEPGKLDIVVHFFPGSDPNGAPGREKLGVYEYPEDVSLEEVRDHLLKQLAHRLKNLWATYR